MFESILLGVAIALVVSPFYNITEYKWWALVIGLTIILNTI